MSSIKLETWKANKKDYVLNNENRKSLRADVKKQIAEKVFLIFDNFYSYYKLIPML